MRLVIQLGITSVYLHLHIPDPSPLPPTGKHRDASTGEHVVALFSCHSKSAPSSFRITVTHLSWLIWVLESSEASPTHVPGSNFWENGVSFENMTIAYFPGLLKTGPPRLQLFSSSTRASALCLGSNRRDSTNFTQTMGTLGYSCGLPPVEVRLPLLPPHNGT